MTYEWHMCQVPHTVKPGDLWSCPECGQGWSANTWWVRQEPMVAADGRVIPRAERVIGRVTRQGFQVEMQDQAVLK